MDKSTKLATDLRKDIHAIMKHLLGSHVITDEEEAMIVVALGAFVISSITKYVNGSMEHGGSLLNGRDLNYEIYQEDIDRFWYSTAKRWNEERNK